MIEKGIITNIFIKQTLFMIFLAVVNVIFKLRTQYAIVFCCLYNPFPNESYDRPIGPA